MSLNNNFDDMLPTLTIDDNDSPEQQSNTNQPFDEDEDVDYDNPVLEDDKPTTDDELTTDDKPSQVATLFYQELVDRGIASKLDKEEFSWQDITSELKSYTEDLPLKVAETLINAIPEEGKLLMNFLLAKQENLTKEDLSNFYNEHLQSIDSDVSDDESARSYLQKHYEQSGKFRKTQITAMLDALEDEGDDSLIQEANKIKQEVVSQKEQQLEQERLNKVTNQKQFSNDLNKELNSLDWDAKRVQKIKQSINNGTGNELLSKIVKSPNGLVHLYNFMLYFDENSNQFNLSDFAKMQKSKEVLRLKDSLTEDMITSASSKTKGKRSNPNQGFDMSKMQPILD